MKPVKFTDDEAAWAAWNWSRGIGQRKVGKRLGVSGNAVCIAISEFIKKHSDAARRPDDRRLLLDIGMQRQTMAGIVATNYCRQLKRKLRIRVPAGSQPC